ncbi:hypothetical protein TNIN_489601 [Trichonephila inaurata madagascariensis]|uniref:Uncharacterized protein n=1 Tax=Trichonephila inaurata madagascariensis TaxID=2747483 RepID=A0A8X7CMU9_9ARAC|nr:hypothetical protein TNIN_489601 [Trichonephila inaurata madagascariensis]
MHSKPKRKMSRLQFGSLLSTASIKAVTIGNVTSGFSTTGIYSYNPQAIRQHTFAISDGSSNDANDVAFISGVCEMPIPAVASTVRASGSRLSPTVASTSTEHEISCLKGISHMPVVRKRKPSGHLKYTSEVLTGSERRAIMREKAQEKLEKVVKGKTNHKKPSTKQKKRHASLSFSSEKIHLDASGNSLMRIIMTIFVLRVKRYFYAKICPKCDWI